MLIKVIILKKQARIQGVKKIRRKSAYSSGRSCHIKAHSCIHTKCSDDSCGKLGLNQKAKRISETLPLKIFVLLTLTLSVVSN